MDLPPALAPWAASLSLFPRELALALGPLVQRLDLAVGPLQALYRPGSGDPEGFAGLTRRGPYERLLLSEWLLAEEAPEEFARRAAMGEHGFLELARREPGGARVSVALFDAGPDQVGTPRLAHLASLVVLARRAEVHGAKFQWGLLQDPQLVLRAVPDREAVLHLLNARTATPGTDAHLEAWRARLEAEAEPVDDFWLVGGRAAACFAAETSASVLQVEDPYEPEAHPLDVTIRRPDRGDRRITLELPPATACVRLLRDPFGTATTPVVQVSNRYAPASSLVWGPSSSKLFARAADNTLVTYSLPNSPRGEAGKPRLQRPASQRPILAVGRVRKSTVVLTLGETAGEFRVERLTGRLGDVAEGTYWIENAQFPAPEGFPNDLLPLWFRFTAESASARLYATLDGSLYLLSDASPLRQGKGYQAVPQLPAVVGAGVGLAGQLVGAVRMAWGYSLTTCPTSGPQRTVKLETPLLPVEGQGDIQVFFGWGGGVADPQFGLVAARSGEREWIVFDRNGQHLFRAPGEGRVVGVVFPGASWAGPALVLLGADRHTLWLLGRERHVVLPRSSAPIAHVAVSPHDPLVAYSTVAGDVCVYSLPLEAFLYRLTGEVT